MTDSLQVLAEALADRYRVERHIGTGGMALVYLAEDLKHHRKVAIKVLRPELAAVLGPERFLREIEIAAPLSHPHILPLYDSGEVQGFLFYVMPFVEGESLRARLDREKQLPLGDALQIALDVADALEYAHRKGIVHRDVKPDNIMLSGGHAVIADFGIARALDLVGRERLTATSLTLGTPDYMSPEQAADDAEVDGRSDLYSLGCVLYEMLTGVPPFTGTSYHAILARHMTDTVPSVRAARETVPLALDAIISRLMAKLPVDRFASAGQVREEIQRMQTGAVPVTSRRRRVLWPWLAVGTAVVALAVFQAWRGGRSPTGLDPQRIMVFPLVVSEGFPGGASVGEDVATVIGSTLDGTGPLRWIDGWALLDPDRRADIRALSDADARAVARAQRCGFYVTGRVAADSDSTALVSLTLFDVRDGAQVKRASATAPLSQVWRGVRAVNTLLPTLIPGGTADVVSEWESRPPLAIASFLVGESAFRRLRLEEALASYRSAVAADSTFAFAALRGAQAASWAHRPAEASDFMDLISRQPLPPRYEAFGRGYRAYLEGDAESAIASFHEALAIDGEMVAAWLQLGESWIHLMPEAGAPDDSAYAALTRAIELDSTAINPLFHTIEILARRGDLERVEPLVERFLGAGPEEEYTEPIRILFHCLKLGSGGAPWDSLAVSHPLALLRASNHLGTAGSQVACAKAGYEALLRNDTGTAEDAASRRFFEIQGLQNLLLAQGRESEALEAVDAHVARWGSGSSLYLLNAPLYERFVSPAWEVARADADRSGPAYAGLEFNNRLWELGLLEAKLGDVEVAASVAQELERRAPGDASGHARLLAASLEAHVALRRGDTASALGQLETLVPGVSPGDLLTWDEAQSLGAERLALARLLLARGQYRRALDVASVFDSPAPVVYRLYLVPSLRLRADAAAAMKDTRLEDRFRARLEALGQPRN